MRSIKNRRIRLRTNQMQYQTPQNKSQSSDEQQKLPLKPFQAKFISVKQSNMDQLRKKASQSLLDQQAHMEKRRVCTEAQTNDHYQSDFQDYEQSFRLNETVQQQIQIPIQIITLSNETTSFIQSQNEYQHYSEKDLSRIIFKLIQQIQFFRYALQKYKLNYQRLNKQKKQLNYLNALKDKAIDYSYQLQLERQVTNKSNSSKFQASRVRQASVMLKKEKYKTVKESHRKANPSVIELQFLNNESKPQKKELCILREQLLCKKRQYYDHIQYLQELDSKIKFYENKLDQCQSRISLGFPQKLQERKRHLQMQIAFKKAANEQSEIEINLQITNLNNQLSAVEILQLKLCSQMQQLRQQRYYNNFTTKANQGINKLFKKKSIFEANSPHSLFKMPKTPRTPKEISRFYYNPQNYRNSSKIYLKNL